VSHLYLGDFAFQDGDYSLAAGHYRACGGIYQQNAESTLRAARSFLETGDPSGGEEALRRLPANAGASQFQAGVLLANAKRYTAAATHFAAAANTYEDRYQAGFNLALVDLKAGDAAAAVRAAEALKEEFPRSELLNLLAQAYEKGGRTQQAYDTLRVAIGLDPAEEANYLDLMGLCLAHENWDLSLEISGIALERLPNSYKVRMQRGAVLAMKGRSQEAAGEFEAAARLAPESGIPAVALAIVALEAKEPERAIEVLRRRRAQHGGEYRVNWLLAEALIQQGSDGEAMNLLREAVKLDANAVEPRVLLGKLLEKAGDGAAAQKAFEEAHALDPAERTAAYRLAMLYRKSGRPEEAERLLRQVGDATSIGEAPAPNSRTLVRILREGGN